MPTHPNPYRQDLDRNAANHVPLTPLSLLDWAADIFPDRCAVIHGALRLSWAQVRERSRRLASAGLVARGLTEDSQALELSVGQARWLLLPNRQALWSWRQRGLPAAESVWLGFTPSSGERRLLAERGARRVWLSGAPRRGSPPLTAGWQATGERGHLSGSA